MADPIRTRGAASLALWLAATRRTNRDIAVILDVSESTIRSWVSGEKRPRRAAAERLARLTHVDPWEWQRTDGIEDIDGATAQALRERAEGGARD